MTRSLRLRPSPDGGTFPAQAPAAGAARSRHWLDSFRLFALALALRAGLALWAFFSFPPAADGIYYHRLATRLAAGQGYTWLWPDGAVTFAAHYPVGYPGALAALYAVLGPQPEVAMLLNAVVGALACLAVHRLLLGWRSRRIALIGALLVACHPALVAYTPALMTEGVAAALIALSAWAAQAAQGARAPRRRWPAVAAVGGLIGLSALVRPQCVLLAPVLGWLIAAGWPARLVRPGGRSGALPLVLAASLATAAAVAVCAPWTLRNCDKMGRCAFVSVNAGWNLLIGTQRSGDGGWAPVEVPAECREVFDEAEKDLCFERAARWRIAAEPLSWLALAPRKLAVTFDYCGAPGWYLHESNPERFPGTAKMTLGIVETVYERVVLLLALMALWPPVRAAQPPAAQAEPPEPSHEQSRRSGPSQLGALHLWAQRGVVAAGLLFSVLKWGYIAYLALALALALSLRRPGWLRAPVLLGACLATLLMVVLTHAVFFGAGRYSIPVFPLLCGVAALAFAQRRTPSAS